MLDTYKQVDEIIDNLSLIPRDEYTFARAFGYTKMLLIQTLQAVPYERRCELMQQYKESTANYAQMTLEALAICEKEKGV